MGSALPARQDERRPDIDTKPYTNALPRVPGQTLELGISRPGAKKSADRGAPTET
jgi:hypothetical protein